MKNSAFNYKPFILGTGIILVGAFIIIAMSQMVVAQYTGSGNHVVSLSDAQRYIQNFGNNPIAPPNKAVYFERNIYDKILAQPGCVGIRQYFARVDEKNVTLVLVGVDAKGDDLINGIVGEGGWACPPYCGSDGKLN